MLAASSNVRVQEQSGSYVLLRGSSQFDPARMLADGMIAARIRSTVELDGVSQMLESFTTAGSAAKLLVASRAGALAFRVSPLQCPFWARLSGRADKKDPCHGQ